MYVSALRIMTSSWGEPQPVCLLLTTNLNKNNWTEIDGLTMQAYILAYVW